MTYIILGARFGTPEEAVAYIEQTMRAEATDIDEWRAPDGYIGPMYSTVATVVYRDFLNHPYCVRYCFTDRQTEGRGPEDRPWDAADCEPVVDDVHIIEEAEA